MYNRCKYDNFNYPTHRYSCDNSNVCKIYVPDYLTSRVEQSTTLSTNEPIVFGSIIDSSGSSISHSANTATFQLKGGHVYRVTFSVNGVNVTFAQGFVFALKRNDFVTNTRIITQNTNSTSPFNSGSATGYITVPKNTVYDISVVNLGLDSISLVNATIDIIVISSTVC